MLDRKDQKATQEPVKTEPKVPLKQTVQQPKTKTTSTKQTVPHKTAHKDIQEPFIVERKSSRKLSKDVIVEKTLDKSKWNKIYPIIDYSRFVY